MIDHYLALDFETSGLQAFRHAPIEIGITEFRQGEPVKSFETLISPVFWPNGELVAKYDEEAMKISGRTMDDLWDKPSPRTVVMGLNAVPEWHHCPIVAYNSSFDWRFYRRLLQLAGLRSPLKGQWHCAMKAARSELKLERYRLSDVCQHFRLGIQGATHGALHDATLAGAVWWKLEQLKAERL